MSNRRVRRHIGRFWTFLSVIGLLSLLAGCAQLGGVFPGDSTKRDLNQAPNVQTVAQADGTTAQRVELTGAALDAAIKTALADTQVQELISRLKAKGHRLLLRKAKASEIGEGDAKSLNVVIPLTHSAILSYSVSTFTHVVIATISKRNQLITLEPGAPDRITRQLISRSERHDFMKALHQDANYQSYLANLRAEGKTLDEDKASIMMEQPSGTFSFKAPVVFNSASDSQSQKGHIAVPLSLPTGSTGFGSGTIVLDPVPNPGSSTFNTISAADLLAYTLLPGSALVLTGPIASGCSVSVSITQNGDQLTISISISTSPGVTVTYDVTIQASGNILGFIPLDIKKDITGTLSGSITLSGSVSIHPLGGLGTINSLKVGVNATGTGPGGSSVSCSGSAQWP